MRFPANGAGIAIFTNEDLGELTNYIIKYRIIDEFLGMKPVDWNSRYKAEAEQAASALAGLTPGPSNASFPFRLSSAEGKYRSLRYSSDIALCVPSAASSNCTAIFQHLNSTFPDELAQSDLI
ncbi:hypothetical protein B0H14DRAFT_3480795 [Mycena olivaceomarginata]|nr:hypothetical protein B0H14DRAFT_3480795 [Mycena olivaceomarginata]